MILRDKVDVRVRDTWTNGLRAHVGRTDTRIEVTEVATWTIYQLMVQLEATPLTNALTTGDAVRWRGNVYRVNRPAESARRVGRDHHVYVEVSRT